MGGLQNLLYHESFSTFFIGAFWFSQNFNDLLENKLDGLRQSTSGGTPLSDALKANLEGIRL